MGRVGRIAGVAGVAACATLLAAAPAGAVRIGLFGYSENTTLSGPGCDTTDTIEVVMPLDATRIRPFPGFRSDDGTRSGGFRVGDPVGGPDGFGGEEAALVPDYATITSFVTAEAEAGIVATFTVAPSPRWCSGYYTDPDGQPAPASAIPDAAMQPGFHAGWTTAPTQFLTRYVVNRKRLYTLDTKGRQRTRPPRRMAISRGHDLVATGIRWRRWGRSTAFGTGRLRHAGQRLLVDLELYNPSLIAPPDPIARCPHGRVYYRNLAVSVPAWNRSTTYAMDARCTASVVNNAAGDLRPPR